MTSTARVIKLQSNIFAENTDVLKRDDLCALMCLMYPYNTYHGICLPYTVSYDHMMHVISRCLILIRVQSCSQLTHVPLIIRTLRALKPYMVSRQQQISTCTVYPYFIREMQFFECIRLTVHFIREIIKSDIGFVINEIQKKYLWKLERCIWYVNAPNFFLIILPSGWF